VDLYDSVLKIKDKIRSLEDAFKDIGGEQKFWQHYDTVKANIVQTLQQSPEYAKLESPKGEKTKEVLPGQRLVYVAENAEKYFISLDLTSANFNTLRLTSPALVLNCQTWKEFIQKFTPYEYFQNAKWFRQLVLGGVNGKAQRAIMKSVMVTIYNELKSKLL
jgi:hypothetical protein